MHKPNVQAREDPHSLAPIQLEKQTLDADIARIRGGRGLRLTITLLCMCAAAIGGAQLLRNMDAREAYAQAASQLERADVDQSEAFLRCALPNLQRSQLSAPAALHNAIEIATERMDKGYGKLLAQCAPLLSSFEQAIDGIEAPPDMTRQLQSVTNAAGQLDQAWSNYRTYLTRPGQPYDYVQAAPMIEKITNAWEAYQTARTQAKDALAARR
jgi:hypothetical protein